VLKLIKSNTQSAKQPARASPLNPVWARGSARGSAPRPDFAQPGILEGRSKPRRQEPLGASSSWRYFVLKLRHPWRNLLHSDIIYLQYQARRKDAGAKKT